MPKCSFGRLELYFVRFAACSTDIYSVFASHDSNFTAPNN